MGRIGGKDKGGGIGGGGVASEQTDAGLRNAIRDNRSTKYALDAFSIDRFQSAHLFLPHR